MAKIAKSVALSRMHPNSSASPTAFGPAGSSGPSLTHGLLALAEQDRVTHGGCGDIHTDSQEPPQRRLVPHVGDRSRALMASPTAPSRSRPGSAGGARA